MKKLILSLLTIFCTYLQCLPLPEQPVLTATVNDESGDNDGEDDNDANDTDDISEEKRLRNATELNARVKAYAKKKRTDAFRRAITEGIANGTADSLEHVLDGHFDYGLCPSQQADINEDWNGKKPIEVALNLLINRAKEYETLSFLGKYKSLLVDEPWIKREECDTAPHWQPLFNKLKVARVLLNNKNLNLSDTRLNLSSPEVSARINDIRTCPLGGYDDRNNTVEKFFHEARKGKYDCLLT